MKSFLIKFWPLLFFLAVIIFFFQPFVFNGKLPIPADTIVGMYHPFRDVVWDNFEAGVPFKNFLITDPVRQQYPWKELAIDSIKRGQLPLWNPYSFAGTPLLANFQSAVFYPLNLLFFLLPFNLAWGILIFLEPLLAGVFLYFYLRNLNLEKFACLLGGISFSFSGFFIAWLEWGTVLHVGLWLSLVLLSIDKIFQSLQSSKISNIYLKNQKLVIWSVIFIFSLVSSFFAGHLQTFFYVGLTSLVYLLARWWQFGRNMKQISLFTIHYSLFIILTAVQWLPTFQFINLSGRGLDQINWQKEGWFIPWQNLVQFLAPDFFGNPSTLNYWGIWNYAEFVGYIGVLPLILAFCTLIYRQDKKTLFFGTIFFLSLLFAFPTPLGKMPYQLPFPLLSTSQPTRLLFLTDFSLAILAALGMDSILKNRLAIKNSGIILFSVGLILVGLWVLVITVPQSWPNIEWVSNLAVSKRNLILPTTLFAISGVLLIIFSIKRIPKMPVFALVLVILVFDLLRFGQKFTPFVKEGWLFPKTKTIEFLQRQGKPFRLMTTDRRIFPPNFSAVYQLESVDGYDPLYLSRYAELIAASERKRPDITPPLGFNRIITPQNFESHIMDLLNVKYVLSLEDLNSKKLKKVFQEGQTRVYENLKAFPRAFLVHDVKVVTNRQEVINLVFNEKIDLRKTAIAEEAIPLTVKEEGAQDEVEITEYREQKITVETKSQSDGLLILSQNFYPGWQAWVNGESVKTYQVDYNLLGVLVPEGEHIIEFYPSF